MPPPCAPQRPRGGRWFGSVTPHSPPTGDGAGSRAPAPPDLIPSDDSTGRAFRARLSVNSTSMLRAARTYAHCEKIQAGAPHLLAPLLGFSVSIAHTCRFFSYSHSRSVFDFPVRVSDFLIGRPGLLTTGEKISQRQNLRPFYAPGRQDDIQVMRVLVGDTLSQTFLQVSTTVRHTQLELELIQSHMAQEPVLWGEVGCACVAREVSVERGGMGERGCARRLGGWVWV